jgi:hypothetical protein
VHDGKTIEMWGVPRDPYAVDEFFAAGGGG